MGDEFPCAWEQPGRQPPPLSAIISRTELPFRVWQIGDLVAGRREPRDAVEQNFKDYHRANPHVYDWFDRYARIAIGAGKRHGSAWHIVNGLRWEAYLKADDPSTEFTICNDYIGLFARWWMERNIQHIDFFSTKLRGPEAELVRRNGWQIEGRA